MERLGSGIHFVWQSDHFPYYCRLAVESAVAAMPDTPITIHLLSRVRHDRHLRVVASEPTVSVSSVSLEDIFEPCPGGSGRYLAVVRRLSSPAALSNLVRLAILHHRGGVYLDTDLIVLRSLHDPDDHGAYVGHEWVWGANRARVEGRWRLAARSTTVPWVLRYGAVRLDTAVTGGRLGLAETLDRARHHRLQVNNAVIGAPRRAAFVEAALATALEVDPTRRFALGPSLLDDIARALPRSVHVLPPSRFYPVAPGESFRCFGDVTLRLPSDAMVLHYVASNHRRLLERLDADDPRFDTASGPFWSLAREVRIAADNRRSSTDRRASIHLVRP